ncbi:hypothetical protein LTS08_004125 [Lithohypha guttulata]|nr:hypothetical protein LTS08_004125 [Lithohypha guttulata]
MAGTITATISAVSTLLSTTPYAPVLSTSTPATTSEVLVSSSQITSTSTPSSVQRSTSDAVSSSNSDARPSSLPSTSNTVSSASTQSTDPTSSVIDDASSTADQSSFTTSTRSASSTLSGSASATSTYTAAAATNNPQQEQLSTGAIAGIATGAVVVVALAAAYLAYLWVVKRKEKQRRRSQRFSTWFPPSAGDDTAGSGNPASATLESATQSSPPSTRFYAATPMQEKRKSFWRGSQIPSSAIGVAVVPSIPPSHEAPGAPAQTTFSGISWPSSATTRKLATSVPTATENRWSIATSFDEDNEAHDQDIPILASPKARSSSRSFSSVKVEKPAPLHLGRVKIRAESPPSARMPLTPVYDNGAFEASIRQVLESPPTQAAAVRMFDDQQAPNFSRRKPSFARTSQDENSHGRSLDRGPSGRFPIKATTADRKQSQVSNRTNSAYTEIEEDDTPENEENKQLQLPIPVTKKSGRPPLRDLQWPQIPRPSALAKQAQKLHSPRAAMAIKQVGSSTKNERPQLQQRTFYKSHTSSSSDMLSISPVSPVFPAPPTRVQRSNPAKPPPQLAMRMSHAYQAAPRPSTAITPTRSSNNLSKVPSNAQQPGVMYQQIQRLNTGRPLAQKLQNQGYLPRTTYGQKYPPVPYSGGDLYFRLGRNQEVDSQC